MLTVGSLCTGYGGLDLAAEIALGPLRHRWYAEVDPAAAAIVADHWPGVPNLGDITAVDFNQVDPVDVLVAGYPCQGESMAGRRRGTNDERWLGDIVCNAVRLVGPRLVILENVAGHLSMGFGRVLGHLASSGYVGSWLCLPAADVGAPHRRERVFIVAYPAGAEPPRPATPARHDPVQAAAAAGRVALLPTPTAADDGKSPEASLRHKQHGIPGGARSQFTSLGVLARAGMRQPDELGLLPTPAAADGDRTSSTYARGNPTLTGALLPTPGASDTGGAKPVADRRTHDGPDHGPRLQDVAVNLLPTPTAADGRSGPGHATTAQGSPDLRTVAALLPTPQGRDGRGAGPIPAATAQARHDSGRRNLDDAVALLPTPNARDHKGPDRRGPRADGAARTVLQASLPRALELLPTPVAVHWGRNATCTRYTPNPGNDTGWTLADVAYADRWGRYAAAIARWEHLTGRPAPDPTEPGRNGPRLAAPFVEWMMGLPAGWVTAHTTSRNAALRILGNGVVPQQGAAAITELLARVARP